MAFKAAVRAVALTTVGKGKGSGSIAAAESHAKREDPIAKKRSINKKGCAGWSKSKTGLRDYVDAFKEHKLATGAGERKNAALALELKVIISPDWFAEDGADPHSFDNNPRVKQALSEARRWAESWGGKGSVWASRYDKDEKGSGVIDIFMSPVREQKHKNGKSKLVISCRKAKEELLATEQARDAEIKNSGAAMQSSWARWCQERLDKRIERGQSKQITGREHIHADIYAAEAEKAKAKAKLELDSLNAELANQKKRTVEALNYSKRTQWDAMSAQRDAEQEIKDAKKKQEEAAAAIAASQMTIENINMVPDVDLAIKQLKRMVNILVNVVKDLVGEPLGTKIIDTAQKIWDNDDLNSNSKANKNKPEPPTPNSPSGPSM